MSPADSLLWRIESDPVLRSTVTAVSLLDRSPDWGRLHARMLQASTRIPRMRQVVATPPFGMGSPRWIAAPDFDIDYHLRRVRLSQPAGFEAVLEFAAREAMAEFDRARPLWEFTVVEGIGRRAAFVQKFHHAVTDGIGGIRLALEILDTSRQQGHGPETTAAPADAAPADAAPADDVSGAASSPGRAWIAGALESVGSSAETVTKDLRRMARLPFALAGGAVRAGRSPLRSANELAESLRWGARLLAPVRTPISSVMTSRGTRLGFGAFDVDMEHLRNAARRGGGSLNDAFITAVGAGLRRYHAAHGSPVTELRMTLPISIRSSDDPLGGNRFTPVRFAVPVGQEDTVATMAAVRRLVQDWRTGPALEMTDALATVLNALPTRAVTQVFGSMLRNVDFVATNVPGLPVRAYLAGAELLRQYAFAPPSGSAVNVALLSHLGHCCIGVNMDRAAIEDPDVLVSSIEEGFDEVLALSGLPEPTLGATVTS